MPEFTKQFKAYDGQELVVIDAGDGDVVFRIEVTDDFDEGMDDDCLLLRETVDELIEHLKEIRREH